MSTPPFGWARAWQAMILIWSVLGFLATVLHGPLWLAVGATGGLFASLIGFWSVRQAERP